MIDIGVNLTHTEFSADLDAVMARAREAGVQCQVVTGCDADHSRQAIQLAQAYPGELYATAGIHPHEASGFDRHSLVTLEALAASPEVVALGECGLDFNRDYSPRDQQEYCFEAQLELAASLQLPVFLHQRDAHPRFMAILSRYRDQLVDAVAHCFTGDGEELAACLDMDLHIGITGWICDERRGRELQQLVRRIPADRLMIETDAPYLLPRDLKPRPRSRRNEPMYLAHVCAAVAHWREEPMQQVAQSTTETARRFFRLEPQGFRSRQAVTKIQKTVQEDMPHES